MRGTITSTGIILSSFIFQGLSRILNTTICNNIYKALMQLSTNNSTFEILYCYNGTNTGTLLFRS